MTHHERIMAAIRGEAPDRLPWVPRLEFWYRAHCRQGSLPAELRSLSLAEIADRLGVGYYASIPDFTDTTNPDAMIDRALGIFHFPVLPYRLTLQDVDRRVVRRGHETTVEYHTPLGKVRTVTNFTQEMLEAGASMSWIVEPAIREPRDFDVVGYIFSHLHIEPEPKGYLAYREQVGAQGLAVGYLLGTACPIHHIMKELMPIDQFFYALHDYPEKVQRLADQMQPFYQRLEAIGADSPAEVIFLGGNYDDSITYPPFFEKHILPPLRDYARVLHRQQKFLMTHTDGENKQLLALYMQTGFDIADSVCPYPMTRCRLEEIRAAFADRITVWGGIPSTLLCSTSTPEDEFRRSIDELVERYGQESHFILGVSDMVTAEAEWDRMHYITDKVATT
jgi:Uroporphyrinogen decarboxylase (URO-D)